MMHEKSSSEIALYLYNLIIKQYMLCLLFTFSIHSRNIFILYVRYLVTQTFNFLATALAAASNRTAFLLQFL